MGTKQNEKTLSGLTAGDFDEINIISDGAFTIGDEPGLAGQVLRVADAGEGLVFGSGLDGQHTLPTSDGMLASLSTSSTVAPALVGEHANVALFAQPGGVASGTGGEVTIAVDSVGSCSVTSVPVGGSGYRIGDALRATLGATADVDFVVLAAANFAANSVTSSGRIYRDTNYFLKVSG